MNAARGHYIQHKQMHMVHLPVGIQAMLVFQHYQTIRRYAEGVARSGKVRA
jgi:hypothetical protein